MKFLCLLFVNFFCIAVSSVPYQDSQIVETKVIDSNPDKTDEPTELSIVHIPKVMDTSKDDEQLTNQQIDTALDDSKGLPKEPEWNKKDIINIVLSIIEIIAVVVIYLLTQLETKKHIRKQRDDTEDQMNKQHEDTEEQIKQQHKDTEKLINKMQEHSNERNKNLLHLGKQIQTSTGKIEKSVKHLEQRFVLEHNKPRVTGYCSTIIADYEALCEELKRNYYYFVSGQNNDYINQRASSIKRNIQNISRALNGCFENSKMPDPQVYLESINDIVSKPSLKNKRKQTDTFKEEGKKFNDQLEICIHNIFSNK